MPVAVARLSAAVTVPYAVARVAVSPAALAATESVPELTIAPATRASCAGATGDAPVTVPVAATATLMPTACATALAGAAAVADAETFIVAPLLTLSNAPEPATPSAATRYPKAFAVAVPAAPVTPATA